MPEEAEAGDVGRGMHRVAELERSVAGARVERGHDAHRFGDELGCGGVTLHGSRDHTEADRLGQHEVVAGLGAGVGEDAVGMHGADDRKAVFRLGVVDRVAAGDERTGGAHDVGPAVENPSEQLERQVLTRPRHQVQRQQRRAAHRVHVRERVRGRDAAPVVRVVDDGSEEVRRDDDGEVVP